MDDKSKELCPRLIDFLVIVGRRAHVKSKSNGDSSGEASPPAIQVRKSRSREAVVNPELLRRYPTDDHKDFHLPTDVTFFCQPEGCLTSTSHRRIKAFRDTSSFVFTLTDKDSGKTRYGVTLNFFLTFDRTSRNEQVLSPNTPKKKPIAALTSLCIMSHHPFLSAYRDILTLLRQLIDACNHRCNQNQALSRDAVWSVLTGHWTGDIPTPVMQEIREIETWILMLLSSPVPVPGKTKVVLEVLPLEIMPMIEFALPDHTRFSLIDFPLHLPIELLGVDVVVRLLVAVILEHKVVLQSRNYNAVSMCVMALVALMYPLEYMFPVIPLLPVYMPSAEQLFLAPTPFIIGVPASFFAVKKIAPPPDIILVDLDTNEMVCGDGLDLPDFPEPEMSILKDDFRRALGKMTAQAPTSDESGHRGSFEASYTIDGDEIDVATRVAMIKFFNSPNIFANFSEHCRTLRLYPRPVVALQAESFLRSRPILSVLIQELCKTQSVEYFAECSLCPKNETYVRVQTGISAASQIGDKAKWFTEQLMPLHFNAYPDSSTLTQALQKMKADKFGEHSDSEDDDISDMETSSNVDESSAVESPYAEANPNFEAAKPLSEVDDVYCAPKKLELPHNESALSIDSSASSGRSSPTSSVSAAADSEADFARLAENLALKSDGKGEFSFDHSGTDDNEGTPVQGRRGIIVTSKIFANNANHSSATTPTNRPPPFKGVGGIKNLQNTITDSGEKVFGPNLMSALNGYAEKSHGVLSQVLNKTAPKAQALRDKTMRPLAEAAANKMEHGQHLITKKNSNPTVNSSTAAANQQNKSQQTIREICEQILVGQSIGVFTYPKVKRLLEDESLREFVCNKLNLGLDLHYAEDDFLVDRQLTKSQYKGYLKILQACISGLEHSYNTPGSNGTASMFHVLEIAHSHYWAENDSTTPGSGLNSLVGTPSASNHNIAQHSTPSSTQSSTPSTVRLPATQMDSRQIPGGSSMMDGPSESKPAQHHPHHNGPPPSMPPPPLPPRKNTLTSNGGPPTAPPPPLPPLPPLPSRPPLPVTTEKKIKMPPPNHVTVDENVTPKVEDHSTKPLLSFTESPSTPLASQKFADKQHPEGKVQTPTALNFEKKPKPDSLPVEPIITRNSPEQIKHYLFRDLITHTQNPLWQQMTFWENAFFDMVAMERDIIGMDQEPSEMIDRYSGLSESEKKRLELEEDRILATLLHNMTAYMIMCGAPTKIIQQKVRRLLGKAHIGLVYSKKINLLLDELPKAHSNNIPLKPLGSRLMQKQSFTVHTGSTAEGTMMFLEVTDDAVILRAITGAISERWWYERLVNMTYSPKTKVLCLWRRHDDQVHMHKFYTKKCRTLYNCLKAAMERAAARGKVSIAGRDLGGEFPVHDIETNEGGLLQVRMDGVGLVFDNRQEFIELGNIKKCNTFGGNMFVLEEYNRQKNELIQRRYISKMADQICYAVLCVFSFVAAHKQQKQQNNLPPP
uniref:MAP kinase-activating death domain protein n=1 Tax=Panagrellus redivivus TaxID=6233 RepID=A0A7E4W4U7_PANRE